MRLQYALRASRLLRRYYSSQVTPAPTVTVENHIWGSETFQDRVNELSAHYAPGHKELEGPRPAMYPRMPEKKQNRDMAAFRSAWQKKEEQGTWELASEQWTINGRYWNEITHCFRVRLRTDVMVLGKVTSVRRHGKKLAFLNISQGSSETNNLQVMCSLGSLDASVVSKEDWNRFVDTVKAGDMYCMCDLSERMNIAD